MPNATIVLFDIDGTLILTGGAGRRAMEAAFSSVLGRDDACERVVFEGMTDWGIVRSGLRSVGAPDDAEQINRVLDAYIERLAREVAQSTHYRVMPGIFALLDALAKMERVAIGLGTGNLRRGADVKLDRGGLAARFRFGGFGCDHEVRSELLRIGAERGAMQLARARTSCRVVVVGDTPRDVDAALAIGAECVGVGTGGFAPSELSARGAAAVFEDLAHPHAIDAIVG